MYSNALSFIGRLLIGLPFAMGGLMKLASYGRTTALIATAGLPFPPLAYAVAVAIELGGGLLLILGYRVRPAAVVMAVFSLVTAVFFHADFANELQMANFIKNVMLTGGLLQIAAFGAGTISIEQWRRRRSRGLRPETHGTA